MPWIENNQIKITWLRLGYPLVLIRELDAHTFEWMNYKIKRHEDKSIIIKKRKENFH